ncbi:hypothetical protein GCM10009759_04000 [Kitasatospora saccharophila]|uniref:Uncharacterized protein n=1 Tax=Kitasatospora saccharophila TaxID=407973 RepID=A0ABN2W8N1_9ACTN
MTGRCGRRILSSAKPSPNVDCSTPTCGRHPGDPTLHRPGDAIGPAACPRDRPHRRAGKQPRAVTAAGTPYAAAGFSDSPAGSRAFAAKAVPHPAAPHLS